MTIDLLNFLGFSVPKPILRVKSKRTYNIVFLSISEIHLHTAISNERGRQKRFVSAKNLEAEKG